MVQTNTYRLRASRSQEQTYLVFEVLSASKVESWLGTMFDRAWLSRMKVNTGPLPHAAESGWDAKYLSNPEYETTANLLHEHPPSVAVPLILKALLARPSEDVFARNAIIQGAMSWHGCLTNDQFEPIFQMGRNDPSMDVRSNTVAMIDWLKHEHDQNDSKVQP